MAIAMSEGDAGRENNDVGKGGVRVYEAYEVK
jgi:hypothetical protein